MEGIRRVIEVALGSPQFLYRIDLGEPAERSGVTPLTSWEIATRLSYLVWVSMPDESLCQAAAGAIPVDAAGHPGRRCDECCATPAPSEPGTASSSAGWTASAVRTAPKPPEKPWRSMSSCARRWSRRPRQSFARRAWEADQKTPCSTRPSIWANADMARFYGLTPPAGRGSQALRHGRSEALRPAHLSGVAGQRGQRGGDLAGGPGQSCSCEEVLCDRSARTPVQRRAVAADRPAAGGHHARAHVRALRQPRLSRLPPAVRSGGPGPGELRRLRRLAHARERPADQRLGAPAGQGLRRADRTGPPARRTRQGVRLPGEAVVPLRLRARPLADRRLHLAAAEGRRSYATDTAWTRCCRPTVETDAFRTRTHQRRWHVRRGPCPAGRILRGAAGTLIGLPWLEAMTPAGPGRAGAAGGPLRRALHPQRPSAVGFPRARRRRRPAGHAHPAAADPHRDRALVLEGIGLPSAERLGHECIGSLLTGARPGVSLSLDQEMVRALGPTRLGSLELGVSIPAAPTGRVHLSFAGRNRPRPAINDPRAGVRSNLPRAERPTCPPRPRCCARRRSILDGVKANLDRTLPRWAAPIVRPSSSTWTPCASWSWAWIGCASGLPAARAPRRSS